jgi:DNA-binding MarR family transcriptional regulator
MSQTKRRTRLGQLFTQDERDAWVGFLHAHAGITRALDDDLRLRHGIALNAFEVLAQLTIAPDGRLRMADLADKLVFTRSGVTRLIDRLESAGLVVRCSVDDDLRGVYAEITDQGVELARAAAKTHIKLLHELFFDKLERGQLPRLARLWQRLTPATCLERERRRRLAARNA